MNKSRKKLEEKLKKHRKVTPQLSKKKERGTKRAMQHLRRELRKQKEVASETSDAWVEELLEQRRIIKEVEGT